MKATVIPIVIGVLGTIPKGLVRELEEMEIGGRAKTIQTTALLKIGQNIEKSPGDLRRLAVTQAPVREHQLTLMRKLAMNNNNNKYLRRTKKNYSKPNYIVGNLIKGIHTWVVFLVKYSGPFFKWTRA